MGLPSCQTRVHVARKQRIQSGSSTAASQIPKVGYGYYYEYSSKPCCYPLVKPPRRPKYRSNVEKPRGVHDFYNMMWDPHVYRGKTHKTFQEVETERARILTEAGKLQKRQTHFYRLRPIEIPKTPPPAFVDKCVVNLDRFLIEDTGDLVMTDAAELTDPIRVKNVPKSPIQSKIGFDVSTEILDEEMFKFEEEVEPITTVVGTKLLEQALTENIEEEELMVIRTEINAYEERRRLDQLRIKRIQERNQLMWAQNEALMKEQEAMRLTQKEVEHHIGARMFSRSYLKLLMPQLLQSLTKDGLFEDIDVDAMYRNFTPWLNESVEKELNQKILVAGVLDLMLENLCLTRNTEYNNSGFLMERLSMELPGEGYGQQQE